MEAQMNTKEAESQFLELVQIDSLSFQEGKIARRLAEILKSYGCTVRFDDASTALGGETGNLIAHMPGNPVRPTVLLTSHMDTVVPGTGIKPQIDEQGVVWSDGSTVLGADDKAGLTAILLALKVLSSSHVDEHCPIDIVFTIAEEQGLQGSRQVDCTALDSKVGLCLDSSGSLGTIVVAGPTQVKWSAEFRGRAAHAGVAPERGVSAIKMAATAVSRMPHGRLSANTTVNVGSFVGEGPTNVVRDRVTLQGEARGLDEEELWPVVRNMEQIFQETASEFGGSVQFREEKMYSGFSFGEDSHLRRVVEKAMESVGLQPFAVKSGGGSDANIFTQNGIPTLNVGIGYEDIHSTSEHVALSDIVRAAKVTEAFCRLYGR
ncbi:M20/M25/M40 family metallo-hydrolase [Alicyclobacillus mengziensis]|uniref:M20/M25/M40 family metallo-hydrolase n=1 Tax=Alicyclobacillus mengziensis TaxID=2931921 RepID=A0A9X7VWH2_9BACL|nr:M20/M25/M40 family metallo-hydrolase [Alicyclobacillus mengziensis]QSO45792.1 M20/M25/M40 family metallo-hydrolase [Alicyclobacillus mengziensis]